MSVPSISTSTVQSQQSTECAQKKSGSGRNDHAKKMEAYNQLVQQAQALGIKNIPEPQKGEKGSLDNAITALQSQIAQAQQAQQGQQGNSNLTTTNPLFSSNTVGLLPPLQNRNTGLIG